MMWCGSNNHDKDIIDLCRQDTFGANDIVPVNSGTNRDDRGVLGSAILAYIQANYVNPAVPFVQPVQPTTGQTVTVAPLVSGQSVRLLIKPAGTLAALTITLPGVGVAALPVDGQEVWVVSTQIITALTVNAGGTTNVLGMPTTLATVSAPFRVWYYAADLTWYRG